MLQIANSPIRAHRASTSEPAPHRPWAAHCLISEGPDILQEARRLLSLASSSTHLISSPYPDQGNQLNLQTLDRASLLLALALSRMTPTRDDYAIAPYLESFDWAYVFELLRTLSREANFEWQEQEFYVVIFRSMLSKTADRERLGELDQHSHREACESGGLLKYWFGSPDAERHNLATCLWRNREDAAAGGTGPWHKLARAAAKGMYENISFHTHRLIITDNVDSWRLEDYVHEKKLKCPFHK